MTALTIAHLTIHQDEHGRYSLNDLYKAAGGENRHRPSLWMANKQTKELVAELELEAGIPAQDANRSGPEFGLRSEQEFLLRKRPIVTVSTGVPGTYVVKELVYAYAMWISPAFTLKVIRAYDALMRGELNGCGAKRAQFERWWFERYPNDRAIRTMAYLGEPFWYIGQVIRRAAGTVGRRVSTMTASGVMEADRLRAARVGAHVWWAHRRKYRRQLELF